MYKFESFTPREKTACFTGHRNISRFDRPKITEKIKLEIQALYKRGYRHYVTGGALGFDTLAAFAVIDARNFYGDITLELCLPCRNQTGKWDAEDAEVYELIKLQCDRFSYISDVYTNSCMFERNRVMIDKSSLCIAYVLHGGRSGSAMTVRYAEQVGVPVVNIAEMK